MQITIAKSAGFCFGVSRAVSIVETLLDENKRVCTLGPIIHNPAKVRELAQRGVRVVENPEEVNENEILVIRSHGIPESVYNNIDELGIEYRDATCPFVLKIHRTVEEHSQHGDIILIAGDENHPEIQGIIGHCKSEYYTFVNCKELEELIDNHSFLRTASVKQK